MTLLQIMLNFIIVPNYLVSAIIYIILMENYLEYFTSISPNILPTVKN